VVAFPLWALVVNPELERLGKDPNARNPGGAAVYPVASFVRAHTAATDPIMVADGRSEVYWVAERRAPTRFFDIFGLTGDDGRHRADRLRDLTRRPPVAIVVMNTVRLNGDPDLDGLVRSGRYTKAFSQDGSTVWLRRRM
jgi:hypothetical protein